MFFLVCLCSCGTKESKEDIVIRMLGEELENASENIDYSNKIFYNALKDRLSNPESFEKTSFWDQKAIFVKSECSKLYHYIDSIKTKQKIDFQTLGEKLKYTNNLILNSDKDIDKEFNKNLRITPKLFYLLEIKNLQKNIFLGCISDNLQKTVLNNIYLGIKISENEIVKYCFNKTSNFCGIGSHEFVTTLVNQNSNHLKEGEILRLQVGIGMFSSTLKPVISVDHKLLDVIDGQAIFLKRVKGNSGKHFIPIKVELLEQDGRKIVQTKIVEYTIDK